MLTNDEPRAITDHEEQQTVQGAARIGSWARATFRYLIGWVQGNPEVIGTGLKPVPEDPKDRKYEDLVHTHV